MRTPKQSNRKDKGYKYYAGFSESFIIDILDKYKKPNSRILDPWNGSGTTTKVCAYNGIASVGIDINPAMIPIAWSRLVDQKTSIEFCELILKEMKITQEIFSNEVERDLISEYMSYPAAKLVTQFRKQVITLSNNYYKKNNNKNIEEDLFAISGVGFQIVSQVIRNLMKPLQNTNPSWFSKPKSNSEKINFKSSTLYETIKLVINDHIKILTRNQSKKPSNFIWPEIIIGDSTSNIAGIGNFDLVISSPPYCTRIDYAIATIPELLTLGTLDTAEFNNLRKTMIGTTLTNSQTNKIEKDFGPKILKILDEIKNHKSKAASTYYHSYFRKYFSDITRSLIEIDKLVCNGRIILVIQNSFFKDIEIDLLSIVVEILTNLKFNLEDCKKYESRSIADTNPRYKKYREMNIRSESVLVFSR